MGIDAPNYTQVPNAVLDAMPEMKECELRVTLAIVRKTIGWQKTRDRISITQLENMTGLSRQGVIDGTEQAMKRGTVGRDAAGNGFEYFLLVNDVDHSGDQDSQRSRPEIVNVVDQKSRKIVNVVDTQKKDSKEKKETTTPTPPQSTTPQPAPAPVGGGGFKTKPPRGQPERLADTETARYLAEVVKLASLEVCNRLAHLPLAAVQAEWARVQALGKGGGWLVRILDAPGWQAEASNPAGPVAPAERPVAPYFQPEWAAMDNEERSAAQRRYDRQRAAWQQRQGRAA